MWTLQTRSSASLAPLRHRGSLKRPLSNLPSSSRLPSGTNGERQARSGKHAKTCHVKHAHATAKHASKLPSVHKDTKSLYGGFARKIQETRRRQGSRGLKEASTQGLQTQTQVPNKRKDTTRNRLARVFTRSRCVSESRQGTERGTSEAKAASEHKNEHTSSSNNMENLHARMTCKMCMCRVKSQKSLCECFGFKKATTKTT